MRSGSYEHSRPPIPRRYISRHNREPRAAQHQCAGTAAQGEVMQRFLQALAIIISLSVAVMAQDSPKASSDNATSDPDAPVANPGRPTVSTPATLTPVGYL